jgi:hypothetical protein
MANLDRELREFIEAIDARIDKQIHVKERKSIRRGNNGFPASFEVHHIIPLKIASHYLVYHAAKAGWQINNPKHNSLPLPKNSQESKVYGTPYHRRGADHPRYTKSVAQLLDALEKQAKDGQWSDYRIRNELEKVVCKVIQQLRAMNGGECIDDIKFSSGGCYIATATLTGGGSEADLNLLRAWRDDVLSTTSIGHQLEAFYDMMGPTVASRIRGHRLLACSFLYPFVKPSIWLVRQRLKCKPLIPLFDLLIYSIFLLGLGYGSLLYTIFSRL